EIHRGILGSDRVGGRSGRSAGQHHRATLIEVQSTVQISVVVESTAPAMGAHFVQRKCHAVAVVRRRTSVRNYWGRRKVGGVGRRSADQFLSEASQLARLNARHHPPY